MGLRFILDPLRYVDMSRIWKSAKNRKSNHIRILKRLVLVLIVLALIVGIVAGCTFGILKHIGKNSIVPTSTGYEEIIEYNGKRYKYNKNIFAMAFLGIDQEELKTSDETDFVGASDAMIVLTVDLKTGKAKAIALPREIMTDMKTYDEKTGEFRQEENHQLYLAYAYANGGEQSCNNAVDTIRRVLMNVSIDKYFALDLAGIKPLNDAVGGVILKSKMDNDSIGVKSGQVVTLKGDMAETYVRSRSVTEVTGSLDRLDRQVQYVESFVSQVAPAVMTDLTTVQRLYTVGSQYSQTNMSLANLTYLASFLTSKGTVNFDTYTIDGKMDSYKDDKFDDQYHAAFYPDETSIMETVLEVFYTRIG